MKIVFDKTAFLKDAQMNLFAPRFSKLQEGNVGEWFCAAIFLLSLGWLWYPVIFVGHLYVKMKN